MLIEARDNQDSGTVSMSYLEALVQAHIEEMERDDRVILMGEDIEIYGGGKIVQRFSDRRVWSMPISEGSFTGVGVGAALTGLRPIVDIGIASFMYLASDQIINQAAKLHYMTGGQLQVPIVFRCCMYYGNGVAAQHSDRPYSLFMNVPGLKIVCPTTPSDVRGLLKAAVRDDDPVLLFEDTRLWGTKGPVPVDTEHVVPIGKALIRREGKDVTIVAIGGAMRPVIEAAATLEREGISAEVIDPRTLKPLDTDTILKSVTKTGRLILVENAHRIASTTAEIAAIVAEEALEALTVPICRLCAADIHVPFSPSLEASLYPDAGRVVTAASQLVSGNRYREPARCQ